MSEPRSESLDYARFDALTFDCYGTLIDWETGLDAALRELLGPHAEAVPRDELLERYAVLEAAAERPPYRSYREVLASCGRELAEALGATPSEDALRRFGGSVADWPPFPDSPAALSRLKERFRLGILTNCDDDLFAASNRRLRVDFDWIVTAQQVGGYKPDRRNFEALLERLALPRERVLHVAQSLFHDHAPAKALGFRTVWIDRRHDQAGAGATPVAEAKPDAVFPDMASFAEAATRS